MENERNLRQRGLIHDMRSGKRYTWFGACALVWLSLLVEAHASSLTCAERYRDHLLDGPVPDDTTELLVTAEGAADTFGPGLEAMKLHGYIENRIWLKALGELQPRPPASVRELIQTFSLADLTATRERGISKVLRVELLALWSDTDPEPKFATPAENEDPSEPMAPPRIYAQQRTLYARFSTVNAGHEPLAGLRLQFFGPPPPGSSGVARGIEDCVWRPFDPLRAGGRAEVACIFAVPTTELAAWRSSIDREAATGESFSGNPIVQDVSFRDESHNIPYIPYNADMTLDPEIVRIAQQRAHADCSEDESDLVGTPWDLLVWVGLPAAMGALLGRRFAR